jgi:hypothetical protein
MATNGIGDCRATALIASNLVMDLLGFLRGESVRKGGVLIGVGGEAKSELNHAD